MEYLDQVYDFFRILLTTQVPVSLFTMGGLMIIMSFFLILAYYKYGLLFSLLFIFVWAYVVHFRMFLALFGNNMVGKAVYGFVGVMMIALFIISAVFDGRRGA